MIYTLCGQRRLRIPLLLDFERTRSSLSTAICSTYSLSIDMSISHAFQQLTSNLEQKLCLKRVIG